MSRTTAERLDDLWEAIQRIREYVGELPGAAIDAPVIADAVAYNLLVIGEAVKNLDAVILAAAPEIPWSDIAGMRDLIAHEYFRVDPAIVERTVQRDVSALEEAVRRLRQELGP